MQKNVKYELQQGRVVCLFAVIIVTSWGCKKTDVGNVKVSVMAPNLLAGINDLDDAENAVEEVTVQNLNVSNTTTVTSTPTPTPQYVVTPAPTPTLTPEQMKAKADEKIIKAFEESLTAESFSYIEENHNRYMAYYKANPEMSAIDVITYVNADLDYEFYTNVKSIEVEDGLLVLCNKHNQLSKDYEPDDLEEIGSTSYDMREIAATAFEKMSKAAQAEGLSVQPISTYRSYNYQDQVAYWKQAKIDTFFKEYKIYGKTRKNMTEEEKKNFQAWRDKVSARPGSSEHQLGLAVDVNNGDLECQLEQSFEETNEFEWLSTNCYKYGFILRYPKGKENEDITGYSYEPWHYRYVGVKMAKAVYESGLPYDLFYGRYILPVYIKHPEAAKLSGDEFYDKYLAPIFELVYNKGFVANVNDALAGKGISPFSISPDNVAEVDVKDEMEETLVLSK